MSNEKGNATIDLADPVIQTALGEIGALPQSVRTATQSVVGVLIEKGRERFFCLADPANLPNWCLDFSFQTHDLEGMKLFTMDRSEKLCQTLMRIAPNLKPQPLGLKSSFGFGDRIGSATPGHVAAMAQKGEGIYPIFAQQSTREMERTRRTPESVIADATWGAFRAGWKGILGADADHLKTKEDATATAKAGFRFFTIDPSDHVHQHADDYTEAQVIEAFQLLLQQKAAGAHEYLSLYRDKAYHLDSGMETMAVTLDELRLKRAAVKYGKGLAFVFEMIDHIAGATGDEAYEIEISVDETEQPTSIAEHLFIALELKRRGVPVVSLAPRFIGDFEKGVDYRGDRTAFQKSIHFHAAIAEEYGPYKLSLHSGSDKFSIYPLMSEACRGQIHIKTAGTSYLEALRVIARKAPSFFRRIIEYSRNRFASDQASYHLSSTLAGSPSPDKLTDSQLESAYLDENNGRQIMHVTFGSVLADTDEKGETLFGSRLKSILAEHTALHEELLCKHLGHHLSLLRY